MMSDCSRSSGSGLPEADSAHRSKLDPFTGVIDRIPEEDLTAPKGS